MGSEAGRGLILLLWSIVGECLGDDYFTQLGGVEQELSLVHS